MASVRASLTGASGCYLSTPDSAAVSIAGDIDIRAHLVSGWDSSGGVTKTLAYKGDAGATRTWGLRTNSAAATTVNVFWVDSGGTTRNANWSSATGFFTANTWIRVTLDADNGAGGHTWTLYSSPDGTTWTSRGTASAGAFTTSIRDVAGALRIGDDPEAASRAWTGTVGRFQLRNGIDGTVVADFNPDLDAEVGDTTVVSSATGETWTLNGAATLVFPGFTPPANEGEVPAFHAGTRGPALRLFRHHGGNPRGRNVYYLSDGTVTETDPDSRAVFWTRAEGSPYVVQTWWGSTASAYEVTGAQASALTAAGYTVS